MTQKVSTSELELHISPRQDAALPGTTFARAIESLELAQREHIIFNEILRGNVPSFLRQLVAIETQVMLHDTSYHLTFFVMPDYLSIGSDADYFLIPMTPILAQKVMDQVGGTLPTRKMVDLIWAASQVKMIPVPIPPSPAMVSVEVFREHYSLVQAARVEFMEDKPLGSLVSGHKKDVVLSNQIAVKPNKVFIYGWHYPNGEPIQPLYGGHINWYADYSHGIRVVLRQCLLNDAVMDISEILEDPTLFQLISDEANAMEITRYDTSQSNYP
ncbi:MAG: hypothetical protein K9N29_06835 [Candidatus Marinimicrobia bacterium]|nr:hypothetical protein [Candidatus Neomarinimicrobiota bacterium]